MGEPDHGHSGISCSCDGAADRGDAEAEAIRTHKAADLKNNDEEHHRTCHLSTGGHLHHSLRRFWLCLCSLLLLLLLLLLQQLECVSWCTSVCIRLHQHTLCRHLNQPAVVTSVLLLGMTWQYHTPEQRDTANDVSMYLDRPCGTHSR